MERRNEERYGAHGNILESQISFRTEVVPQLHVSDKNNILNADAKAPVGVIARLVGNSHSGL